MIVIVGYKDNGEEILPKIARRLGGRYERSTEYLRRRGDVVIPWGWLCYNAKLNPCRVTGISKAYARQVMQDAGVPVPKIMATSLKQINKCLFPCVVRPDYHKQGNHFYLCYNKRELRSAVAKIGKAGYGWYASEFIDKAFEFRVHVAGGKVVFVQNKKFNEQRDGIVGRHNCAVHKWDWMSQWEVEHTEGMAPVLKAAIDACRAVRFDFGAVDVCCDYEDKPFVFEINTAPSLYDEDAKPWADAFRALLKNKRPRKIGKTIKSMMW